MELALICLVIGAAIGSVGGYILATHIHSVASAASRAVTIPAGDIVALNAKIDGLGDKVQAASADLAQHVTNTIEAVQPKAAS